MPPVETTPDHYMTPEVARQMAAEIAEAGGVEVFFVGRRSPQGLVHEVESHAFGSARAVPVLMHLVKPGDVIFHNHPSGELVPSEADIEISSILGNQGVGSFIINNDCTRVRMIVRPHDAKKKTPLDPRKIERMLGPDSPLAREMGDYEDRPQQRRMAHAIADAFNNDGIAVVEAGTGTGKSLAYLVPSIMYALENKERVVIATHTINLQEQVLNKDLPLVRNATGLEFRAELVKGRSNYVCKRKAQFAREELSQPQQTLIDDDYKAELRELLAWAKQSQYGDRQELPVPPREEAWERIGSEADNCLRVRCPFYEECFFYNSRRRAARADIIVVNHSLLMSDLAVRRESNNWTMAAVLPPYQHVILDEAHHLEEVATDHLASQMSRISFRRLFHRLLRVDGNSRKGVLQTASETLEQLRTSGKVTAEFLPWRQLAIEILPRVESVRETIDTLLENFGYAFMEAARLDRPSGREEHRVRITPAIAAQEIWQDECAANIHAIAREIEVFISLNREAISGLRDLEEEALNQVLNIMVEWRALIDRLDGCRRLAHAFLKSDETFCRWVELSLDKRQRLMVRICQAPVSVAAILEESLHNRAKTEVLTSATLTVDGDFNFLFDRVGIRQKRDTPAPVVVSEEVNNDEEEPGLPRIPSSRLIESVLLDTPFDYRSQVFFGVPTDLGDPRNSDFTDRLSDFCIKAISISGGRAFVLFTSYNQMRKAYDEAAPVIRQMGIECLVQGQESRDRLLAKFRNDETSVLFATSSFWEGVDVKGRALELLIIARLPFAVPSDPIQEAQYEYMESQGRDPFSNLVVPRAIIRFKQGFGRLIRSRTDRGAILIADDRVVRMGYGKRFLRSLPEMRVRPMPSEKLMEELRGFFEARPV